jgi:GNAT superfamily N-acetyltransferase
VRRRRLPGPPVRPRYEGEIFADWNEWPEGEGLDYLSLGTGGDQSLIETTAVIGSARALADYFHEHDSPGMARLLLERHRPGESVAYLALFFVDEQARGTRIAERGMRLLFEELAREGASAVYTHFGPNRDEDPRRLRAFVQMQGFVPVHGCADPGQGGGTPMPCLVRPLAPRPNGRREVRAVGVDWSPLRTREGLDQVTLTDEDDDLYVRALLGPVGAIREFLGEEAPSLARLLATRHGQDEMVAYLSVFEVVPRARGTGLAEQGMRVLLEELVREGASVVYTHFGPRMDEDPRRLRAFIQMHGFVPVPRCEDPGRTDGPAMPCLVRPLAPRPNPRQCRTGARAGRVLR